MLGTSDDGFADGESENSTGLMLLKTPGKASFLIGLERIGAMMDAAVGAHRAKVYSLYYGELPITFCCTCRTFFPAQLRRQSFWASSLSGRHRHVVANQPGVAKFGSGADVLSSVIANNTFSSAT